ncbi:hypothetical protein [Treponema sp. R8-4-B8]
MKKRAPGGLPKQSIAGVKLRRVSKRCTNEKKENFFQKVLDKVLEKIVFSKNLRDRKYCVRTRTPLWAGTEVPWN